jgi:hypothetical protein
MAMFVGIDGIRGGWVAVYLDKGRQRSDHACRLESLLVSPTHGAFTCSSFPFSTDRARANFFDFCETACFGVYLVVGSPAFAP